MSDSEFDIKYVANLARIALTPEEEARLGSQLGDILGYVKKLEELDISEVEPMAHAVPLDNVLRTDEVQYLRSRTMIPQPLVFVRQLNNIWRIWRVPINA